MTTGDGDDAELARALPQVLGPFPRVARRAVRRAYPRPPLPDAQVEVLRAVERQPGVGTAAVAEQLQVAANTVSTLVGDLVAAGLLVRGRSASDRRATSLQLTEEARDGLAQWAVSRQQVMTAALGELTGDERAALSAALPALRRLLEVLDRA